jgi:hypothetical protein
VTRIIHSSAAVLLLLVSACEKKSESSSGGENRSGAPSKPTRTERRDLRAERETEAKTELRKALEAAESETDPAAREKALATVAWDGIDIDREIAQKAFAGLTPGGEEARRLIAHFAMRMADDDPEAALEWARGLEQPVERDDAISRIAVVISTSDPQRGASLALEEVPEGLPRNRAVVQIVQRWSQTAPADAATWITSLPDGPARKGAIRNLSTIWSESDGAALSRWVSAHEALAPEVVAGVADSLRLIPDEATRAQRLASFTDQGFRQRVEEDLEKTPPMIPPPSKVPKR